MSHAEPKAKVKTSDTPDEPATNPYADAIAEIAAGVEVLCKAGLGGCDAAKVAMTVWDRQNGGPAAK